MSALAGVNPLEIALMMLLSGGFGFSSGIPPAAEDPLAAKIAPADCLFYISWAGTAEPNGAGGNFTEKILAEPEIKQFLARSPIAATLASVDAGDTQAQAALQEIEKLMRLVQGKAGAAFVSDVQMRDNGPPDVRGGGLLQVGDDGEELKKLLEGFQSKAPPGSVTAVQIGNRSFWRVAGDRDEQAVPIFWGLAGKYLIFGAGDGSVEALMQRASGQPPAWLTGLRGKLTVPRPASLLYVNVRKLVQLGVQTSGDPNAARVVSLLGLDKVTSLASLNGLDERGCVSRALLSVEGPGSGLLSWIDAQPLTATDVDVIAGSAPVAIALQLNPAQVFSLWMGLAEQIDPNAARDMQEGLAQFEQQLGIKVREDLLASFGDTFRIFAQPGPQSLISGWTIAAEVKDRARLERVQQTLVDVARSSLQQAGPGAPTIQTSTVNGQTVHTLLFGQPGGAAPAAPSWCLTDKELFVTVTPEMLKPLLSRPANQASLASRPEVKPLVEGNSRTLALAFVDTRPVVQSLLPLAQFGLGMVADRAPVSLDTSNLPSAEAIVPHLQPTVMSLRRTADGVEFTSQQTLPGANVGAAAPAAVALLLPAVQASREAARRMQSSNNLKQLALAMHNFHDTYRGFPAGYSADEDGKALLSWRVHLLPYLEHLELYNQFHLDEPWDSPNNKALIERMPMVFRSPNSKAEPGKTNYLGISGADGVFVRPQPGERLGAGLAQITDGTSNTIMIVEASDERAVIWTQPADLAPNANDPIQGLTGMRPGGFLASLSDGSVRFIAETIDKAMLKALFTKAGGEVVQLP